MAASLTISKLSRLQKHILTELRYAQSSRPCAMLSFFGFAREEVQTKAWNYMSPNAIDTMYLDGSYRVVASNGQSGSKQYQSAMASISRAIARLIHRALVERRLIYLGALDNRSWNKGSG
jgi:hypothetical protein